MTEQQLRDYVAGLTQPYELPCVVHTDYRAYIVPLDTETIAMRLVYGGHNGIIVYSWRVCSYPLAVSVLGWADAGGNWKEAEGE